MDGERGGNRLSRYPTEGEIIAFACFLGQQPDDFDIDILRGDIRRRCSNVQSNPYEYDISRWNGRITFGYQDTVCTHQERVGLLAELFATNSKGAIDPKKARIIGENHDAIEIFSSLGDISTDKKKAMSVQLNAVLSKIEKTVGNIIAEYVHIDGLGRSEIQDLFSEVDMMKTLEGQLHRVCDMLDAFFTIVCQLRLGNTLFETEQRNGITQDRLEKLKNGTYFPDVIKYLGINWDELLEFLNNPNKKKVPNIYKEWLKITGNVHYYYLSKGDSVHKGQSGGEEYTKNFLDMLMLFGGTEEQMKEMTSEGGKISHIFVAKNARTGLPVLTVKITDSTGKLRDTYFLKQYIFHEGNGQSKAKVGVGIEKMLNAGRAAYL